MILQRLRRLPDVWAILILFIIWLCFFWRMWTPVERDQLSFAEGDFSGQFVAWTSYAVERLSDGEIPLWNPYHYAGAPFQASPQTALTYPPHMLTLALLMMQSEVTPQDVYAAMQREVMLHVLLASWFMYAFVRRLAGEGLPPNPNNHRRAVMGGLVAGIVYAYSSYLGGYPMLQVPLLEAGIWLPLVMLGILEATSPPNPLSATERGNDERTRHPLSNLERGQGGEVGWACLLMSGVLFGISLLAGHPQTAFFMFYMAAAWLAYRVWLRRWNWKTCLLGILLIGLVGGLLAAVQLIPTAEFTQHTARTEYTFEAKGGGYSFEEIINILFPVRGEIWNPLYVGILTLILAGIALWRGTGSFFVGAGVIALLLSFGAKTPLYGILYPVLPGLSLFRGQERATYIIVQSVAVLAGLGAAQLMTWGNWREKPHTQRLRYAITGLFTVSLAFTSLIIILAQTSQRSEAILDRLNSGAITTFILAVIVLGLPWYLAKADGKWRQVVLILLLVFDLFSSTFMLDQNYDPIPVRKRVITPPVAAAMAEPLQPGERIDGSLAVPAGYSTLYRIPDIWGSDPLQLDSVRFYLEDIAPERRWELLNVRVVAVDKTMVSLIPLEWMGERETYNLWKIADPRGFARPVYEMTLVNTLDEARGLVKEPAYLLREGVILETTPGELTPDATPGASDNVSLTRLEPEHIAMQVSVPRPAVLSFALPYYPGWRVQVDGQEKELLRAYGGLSAVYLPAGTHVVRLDYQSNGLLLGAILSGMGWLLTAALGIGLFVRARRMNHVSEQWA